MNPQLIIAALIAVAGFGTAWKVQDWRYNAKEKERAEQQLEAQRMVAAASRRQREDVIAAQNEAQVRANRLRMDAAGSRAALIGLSNATEQAMRDAALSHAACTERAHTIGVVLNQCAGAYQELGAVADRHASDVQTLIGAWPK